ncbi:hypothetical protein V8C34DRAFT_72517 [Trichoderma compactum]
MHLRSPSTYYYMLAFAGQTPLGKQSAALFYHTFLLAYTRALGYIIRIMEGEKHWGEGQLALFLTGLANGVLLFLLFPAFLLLHFAYVG